MTGNITGRSISISNSRLRMLDLGSNQFPYFEIVESARFGMDKLTSIDSLHTTDS